MDRRRRLLTVWRLVLGSLILCPAGPALAATTTYQRGVSPTTGYTSMNDARVQPSDTSTPAQNPDVIYLNYPKGAKMVAYFDVSGIPAGSTVTQATIKYLVYNGSTIQKNLGIYRVTKNWRGGVSWTNAGGDWADKNGAAQGSVPFASVLANFNDWYSWDITPIVQGWVSGTFPNYGVLIKVDGSTSAYGQTYASGHGSTSVRPKLIVTYSSAAPDTTSPTISGVSVSGVTSSAATVTWTTNETATSQVDYGTTTSYGQATPLNSSLITSHSVAITGLTANTTYHYRARSKDAANNEAIGTDQTFTTAPPPDTTPPTGSVTINGGAPATNNATVTLSLSASDNSGTVAQMKFSNDGGTTYSAAEPYAAVKTWTLPAGDGSKTVSVKFADAAGNWSTPTTDTITLDTTPPGITITSPSNGAVIVAPAP